MVEIWGIVWTRDDKESEPTWYDTKYEAIAEYNSRGDKYWHCPLVRAEITDLEIVKKMRTAPFECGYDDFYYEATA